MYWLYRYKEGALKAKQGLSEATSSAVDLAARELVSLTESYGAGPVDEGDIDELLQWTNGLNYDKSVCPVSSSVCSAYECVVSGADMWRTGTPQHPPLPLMVRAEYSRHVYSTMSDVSSLPIELSSEKETNPDLT